MRLLRCLEKLRSLPLQVIAGIEPQRSLTSCWRDFAAGGTSQPTNLELLRDDWVEVLDASGPYFWNWRHDTVRTTISCDQLPRGFR